MAKAVKMADIAAEMGVSTVTVSKALSDQKGVSEDMRAKIKAKAEEMGYMVKSTAVSERSKSYGYNIGVIVSNRFLDKYESFYWKMYQEVATAAVTKGCFTMLEVLMEDDEEACKMPELLQQSKVEGLIVVGRLSEDYLESLKDYSRVPITYLDFYVKNEDCDSVISNSFYGTYKLTNYLFDMGHRDIAFMGNVLFTDSITDRYFGYAKSLCEHGLDVNKDWVIYDRNPETGRNDVDFEVKLPKKMPTAFVCNSDAAASMLIKKLLKEGYKVPEDISVVGYDNYQPPGLCNIRITSHDVDMRQMAIMAIKKIVKKISGEHYKQGVAIVEGHIEYKDSVARKIY